MEKVKDLKRFSLNDNVLDLIDLKFLPRWVILVIDILIIIVSLFISHLLIMGLEVRHYKAFPLRYVFLFIVTINVLYMYIFRTYLGVIRHSTFVDLFKLFFANLCCVLTIVIVNYTYYLSSNEKAILIPFLGMYFALSSVFLFVFRLCVKGFFNAIKENKRSSSRKKIYILGDDDTSVAIAQVVLSNPNLPFDIRGFISYHDKKVSIKLLDKNIITKANFINSLNSGKKEVDGVLAFKELLKREKLAFWVNIFLEHDVKIYKAPSLQKLRGKETISQIKTIQIED